MLNVLKKATAVLFIFILPLSLNACRYESRIDFSELIRRINKESGTYTLELQNAFLSEEEWFLFGDTLSESDILITGRADEDKALTSVSVSVINSEKEEQKEIFLSFCKSAVKAFTEGFDAEKIIEASKIKNTELYFSEGAYFSESGRFHTSFFTAEQGCTFIIEIKMPEP